MYKTWNKYNKQFLLPCVTCNILFYRYYVQFKIVQQQIGFFFYQIIDQINREKRLTYIWKYVYGKRWNAQVLQLFVFVLLGFFLYACFCFWILIFFYYKYFASFKFYIILSPFMFSFYDSIDFILNENTTSVVFRFSACFQRQKNIFNVRRLLLWFDFVE